MPTSWATSGPDPTTAWSRTGRLSSNTSKNPCAGREGGYTSRRRAVEVAPQPIGDACEVRLENRSDVLLMVLGGPTDEPEEVLDAGRVIRRPGVSASIDVQVEADHGRHSPPRGKSTNSGFLEHTSIVKHPGQTRQGFPSLVAPRERTNLRGRRLNGTATRQPPKTGGPPG